MRQLQVFFIEQSHLAEGNATGYFGNLTQAAEGTKGKPMDVSLLHEIKSAIKGEGAAVTKKETTHRMAEANKAFAHFAW